MNVQLLSVSGPSSSTCIVVTTSLRKFIVDVPEGTQRLCIEHRVRLGKIDCVCLTRLGAETVCGLPGYVLTASDTGKEELDVIGPSGVNAFWYSTRHFLYRPNFQMNISECSHIDFEEKINRYSNNPSILKPIFQKIGKQGKNSGKSLYYDDIAIHSQGYSISEEEKWTHVAFIYETPKKTGKFDVKKAKALGLKQGPVFGILKNGNNVTMDDGTIITPSMVLDEDIPGRFCIVLPSFDDISLLKVFINDPYWKHFQKDGTLSPYLDCIIHLSSANIIQCNEYQAFLRTFDVSEISEISEIYQKYHLFVGHGLSNTTSSFHAATRYCRKLAGFYPQCFPSLSLDINEKVKDDITENEDQHNCFTKVLGQSLLKLNLLPISSRGLEFPKVPDVTTEAHEFVKTRYNEEPILQEIQLEWQNLRKYFLDNCKSSSIKESATHQKYIDSALSLQKRKGWTNLFTPNSNMEITFLGTGSAVPSKYRNVTSIMIELSFNELDERREGKEGPIMLLDAGEGSWQQLLRLYNDCDSPAGLESCQSFIELVTRLRIIWISHPHADHHLGLMRILGEYKRLIYDESKDWKPMIIIAPWSILKFLEEYAVVDPSIRDSYIPIDCSLLEPSLDFQTVDKLPKTSEEYNSNFPVQENLKNSDVSGNWNYFKSVCTELQIYDITNVKVDHCRQAYGVSITTNTFHENEIGNKNGNEKISDSDSRDDNSKFTIVYSGDTRPCQSLINLGNGSMVKDGYACDVLIHEATFADDKQEEAEIKKHSTISEAINIGKSMGACRTILTHFSQRYPSVPPLDHYDHEDPQKEELVHASIPPILAFDYMKINVKDLIWLPSIHKSLSLIFATDEDEEDDDDDEEEEIDVIDGKEKPMESRHKKRSNLQDMKISNSGEDSAEVSLKSSNRPVLPAHVPGAFMFQACPCCIPMNTRKKYKSSFYETVVDNNDEEEMEATLIAAGSIKKLKKKSKDSRFNRSGNPI